MDRGMSVHFPPVIAAVKNLRISQMSHNEDINQYIISITVCHPKRVGVLLYNPARIK